MSQSSSSSKGSLGCGCFLWVFAGIGFAISYMMFPKLPGYEEVIENGELIAGEVVRVEAVENITINEKHPKRVIYTYGDNQEGSMIIALGESVPKAKKGKGINLRVLGEKAYPEDIRPFARPKWLNPVLIGLGVVGALFVGFAILRLALIGGVLFAAAREKKQANQSSPPPLD